MDNPPRDSGGAITAEYGGLSLTVAGIECGVLEFGG